MRLTTQVLKKINDNYADCIVRHNAHLREAIWYNNLYVYTTSPIIILSSVTTVIASYNGNINSQAIAIAVAICSGLVTIAQALSSFLEFKNKYQISLDVSNRYISLARMIESEFYVNYYNSNMDSSPESEGYIRDLFKKIQNELYNIQIVEPSLPIIIERKDYESVKAQYELGCIHDALYNLKESNGCINNNTQQGSSNDDQSGPPPLMAADSIHVTIPK